MRILEVVSGIYEEDDNQNEVPVGSFMANSQANLGYAQQPGGTGPTADAGEQTTAQQANAQTAVPSIPTIPQPRGAQKAPPLITR